MNTHYKLPEHIPADMGGEEILDERMSTILELLHDAPLDEVNTVLDVGIGKGQLTKWLSKKGKKCTGIGMEIDSYGLDLIDLKNNYGIDVVECNVERMPFADGSFDGIVLSHTLEHCMNVGLTLDEIKRVLSDKGWLFVFVPPTEDIISSGHVSIGWTVGQLMYVLLVKGFDVKNGKFIEFGHHVCAFVQKSNVDLPPLRGDRGDIYLLQQANLFPLPIKTRDGFDDGYYGKIRSINWDMSSRVIEKYKSSKRYKTIRTMKTVVGAVSKILPEKIITTFASVLIKSGEILRCNSGSESNNTFNPKILKG